MKGPNNIPAIYYFLANYLANRDDAYEISKAGQESIKCATITNNNFGNHVAVTVFKEHPESMAQAVRAEILENTVESLDFEVIEMLLKVNIFHKIKNIDSNNSNKTGETK